jgi:hypothetical protein
MLTCFRRVDGMIERLDFEAARLEERPGAFHRVFRGKGWV